VLLYPTALCTDRAAYASLHSSLRQQVQTGRPACARRSVCGSGEVSFRRYVCRGSSPMNIVAFNPADDLLLVAGNDNVVRLYEVEAPAGAAPKQEYRHHKDSVRGIWRGRHPGTRGWVMLPAVWGSALWRGGVGPRQMHWLAIGWASREGLLVECALQSQASWKDGRHISL
jgi:hypothetical protein